VGAGVAGVTVATGGGGVGVARGGVASGVDGVGAGVGDEAGAGGAGGRGRGFRGRRERGRDGDFEGSFPAPDERRELRLSLRKTPANAAREIDIRRLASISPQGDVLE